MATLAQLEAELNIVKEQVTDLNNLVQDFVPKLELKQFSLLVEAKIAAIIEEINKMKLDIENIKSTLP